MIRYIYCIRKKQDISQETFRSFWNSPEYIDILKKVADYYQATRYSQNLTLKVEMGDVLVNKNGLDEPFDATLELFWDTANKLGDLYNNEDAQSLSKKIRLVENNFIDLSRSTAFFTLEEEQS